MKKKTILLAALAFLVILVVLFFMYSKNISKQLNEAIIEDDIEKVQEILGNPAAGIAINTHSGIRISSEVSKVQILPIQTAALETQPEALELLLEKGADTEKRTRDYDRAIICVIEKMDAGDIQCVSSLLQNGANVDAVQNDEYNTQPVSVYAAHQSPYANGETFDEDLASDSVKIYKSIVDVSSDRSEEIVREELENAISANNIAITDYILENNKRIDLSETNYEDDEQPILFSLNYNSGCDEETIKIAKLLIENGADTLAENAEGETLYEECDKLISSYKTDGEGTEEIKYLSQLERTLERVDDQRD